MLVGMWKNRTPLRLLVEMQNSTATVERVWHFLEMLNPEFACDLSSPYTQENWKHTDAKIHQQVIQSSMIPNSQYVETTHMVINQEMDKQNVALVMKRNTTWPQKGIRHWYTLQHKRKLLG